jgi:hypothetical protein
MLKPAKNCTGDRSRYACGARGYCSRCYRVIKRIENIQAWNRSSRDALVEAVPEPGSGEPAIIYTGLTLDTLTEEDKEFARKVRCGDLAEIASLTDAALKIHKRECICQLRSHLNVLRHREAIRRYEVRVTPLKLEQKFAELLRLVRPSTQYP